MDRIMNLRKVLFETDKLRVEHESKEAWLHLILATTIGRPNILKALYPFLVNASMNLLYFDPFDFVILPISNSTG